MHSALTLAIFTMMILTPCLVASRTKATHEEE